MLQDKSLVSKVQTVVELAKFLQDQGIPNAPIAYAYERKPDGMRAFVGLYVCAVGTIPRMLVVAHSERDCEDAASGILKDQHREWLAQDGKARFEKLSTEDQMAIRAYVKSLASEE